MLTSYLVSGLERRAGAILPKFFLFKLFLLSVEFSFEVDELLSEEESYKYKTD